MEKQIHCCLDFLMREKNIVIKQKTMKLKINAFSFIDDGISYIVINEKAITTDVDLLNVITHQLISLKKRLIHPDEQDNLINAEADSNYIHLSYLIQNIMDIVR